MSTFSIQSQPAHATIKQNNEPNQIKTQHKVALIAALALGVLLLTVGVLGAVGVCSLPVAAWATALGVGASLVTASLFCLFQKLREQKVQVELIVQGAPTQKEEESSSEVSDYTVQPQEVELTECSSSESNRVSWKRKESSSANTKKEKYNTLEPTPGMPRPSKTLELNNQTLHSPILNKFNTLETNPQRLRTSETVASDKRNTLKPDSPLSQVSKTIVPQTKSAPKKERATFSTVPLSMQRTTPSEQMNKKRDDLLIQIQQDLETFKKDFPLNKKIEAEPRYVSGRILQLFTDCNDPLVRNHLVVKGVRELLAVNCSLRRGKGNNRALFAAAILKLPEQYKKAINQ